MDNTQLSLFTPEAPKTKEEIYFNGKGEPLPWEEDLARERGLHGTT